MLNRVLFLQALTLGIALPSVEGFRVYALHVGQVWMVGRRPCRVGSKVRTWEQLLQVEAECLWAQVLRWPDTWTQMRASAQGGSVTAVFKGVEHQCWHGASNKGSGMQHCPKVKIPEVAEVISDLFQK